MKLATTAYLLTCAVLGVAGALLLAPANWLSTALFVTAPVAGMTLLGLWILPAVVALRLLQRPGAGVLVGLVSGLVLVPFSGYGFTSVATNLFFGFFAELGFLVVGYRFWTRIQHYAGALVLAIAYPVLAAASYDLWSMVPGVQVLFFALGAASAVVATFLGILIADRLAHAGVAKAARRRAPRAHEEGDSPSAR